MGPRRNRGVTLIELTVAIVIVAIAVTAVTGALAAISQRSADAMARAQAVAIAESYLEEILLKPIGDPDGIEPESGRASFDDVGDYAGLTDVGARDQSGNAIPNLSSYTVRVAVSPSAALGGIGSADARRIDITVSYGAGLSVTLSGYRTNY
jgi:MSHA pilin protein MshD